MAAGRGVRPIAVSATSWPDAVTSPCELKGGDWLAVTISVLSVLAVAVFILCRYAGLRVLHAAVCILFGFFLASSSFAPDISRFVSSLIRLL